MSLLDDEDEPFVESVSRSSTREPLYDGRTETTSTDESFQLHKPKEKKERKKLDDRKSSSKALPWSKSSAEKTPKKGKHHRTKSGSPPPVSPKGRSQEARKAGKGTSSQIQPSPNIKSQRKRYVQLGVEAGSSSEGEVDLEGEGGFLLSNQPALSEQHDVLDSLGQSRPSADTGSPKVTKEVSFFDQETSEAQADAWWPLPSKAKSPRRMTYAAGVSLDSVDVSEAFVPHGGRSSVPTTSNTLLGEFDVFSSQETSQQSSQLGLSTTVPPPLQSTGNVATPNQPWSASVPQEHSREPDWTISDDLRRKCIQQFNDLKPTDGLLQGDKAREFFVQSKLPNQELSAIWYVYLSRSMNTIIVPCVCMCACRRLSDTDKDNALSEVEFCIAMKLVLMRRKGVEIPNALPDLLQPPVEQRKYSVIGGTVLQLFHCILDRQIWEGRTLKQALILILPSQMIKMFLSLASLAPQLNFNQQMTKSLLTLATKTVIQVRLNVLIAVQLRLYSYSGLLVDVNERVSPAVSPPPPEPAVARIISIDTSWELEEDREDTALVQTSQPKSDEEVPSPTRQKPARPAPPKPAARRSKSLREKPELPPRPSEKKLQSHDSDVGGSSPPANQAGDAQNLIIIDSRQKSKSVK